MRTHRAVGHRPVAVRMAALLTAAALAVSACGSAAPRASVRKPLPPSTAAPPTTAAPTTTTTAPVPPVAWSACGGGLQCGTVSVPLDYARPQGPTIAIAVARRPARVPSQRIGSLVINPGGPGDSGIDDLPVELRVLTPTLQDRFDIVSFDPRGVQRSAPVNCGVSSNGVTATLPDPAPTGDAGRQTLIAGARAYAAACQQHSGALLPYVGTDAAARDLDRIRAALGDDRLTYLGHSYGTLLGATYAELFPQRVRALVLDGAVDPSLTTEQMLVDQAVGFEGSLDAFLAWCAGSAGCAWRPGSDPAGAFLALLDRVRRQPAPAGAGRTAGPGELYDAVLGTLTARSFWPSLGRALARLAAGDGAAVVGLSDGYQTHGGPNTIDANSAVTCLDHPVTRDLGEFPALADAAASRAPVFGPVFAWGALTCAVWPAKPTRAPHPIRAPGTPPILVVGTTHDPATPYPWAAHLAGELEHGVLVGRQGEDHVAYYYSSCVRAIDDAYLVAGTVPAAGTVCPA